MALAVVDPEDTVNWHHPQNLLWLDTPPHPPSLQPTQVLAVRLPGFVCQHHQMISEALDESLNPSELPGHLFYGGVMIVLASPSCRADSVTHGQKECIVWCPGTRLATVINVLQPWVLFPQPLPGSPLLVPWALASLPFFGKLFLLLHLMLVVKSSS